MTITISGQTTIDTHGRCAAVIHEIQETYRERVDFLREENALTLRIKARLRRQLGFTGRVLSKAELGEVNVLYRAMLGQVARDTQRDIAELEADHLEVDTQTLDVGSDDVGEDDHRNTDTHGALVVLAYEFELAAAKMALAKLAAAKMALANAGFLEARAMIHGHRMVKEKRLTVLAKSLPVYPWVDGINGFGALGLSIIVGIAGDLSNYSNPAKVWKRFGLAVMDGKAQRKVADAEKAVEMGYSPQRRSAMWTIGDSLLKKQNVYREMYLDRKSYELERSQASDDAHTTGAPLTRMHAHRRAQRYAEKRLLRDLWRAWQTSESLTPTISVSATDAA